MLGHKSFYVYHNQTRIGPLTLGELRKRVTKGEFPENAAVFIQGDDGLETATVADLLMQDGEQLRSEIGLKSPVFGHLSLNLAIWLLTLSLLAPITLYLSDSVRPFALLSFTAVLCTLPLVGLITGVADRMLGREPYRWGRLAILIHLLLLLVHVPPMWFFTTKREPLFPYPLLISWVPAGMLIHEAAQIEERHQVAAHLITSWRREVNSAIETLVHAKQIISSAQETADFDVSTPPNSHSREENADPWWIAAVSPDSVSEAALAELSTADQVMILRPVGEGLGADVLALAQKSSQTGELPTMPLMILSASPEDHAPHGLLHPAQLPSSLIEAIQATQDNRFFIVDRRGQLIQSVKAITP